MIGWSLEAVLKARDKEVTYPLVNAYHVTYGFEVTWSMNYGPNQHPEKLIPMLITNALRGKLLPICGSGQNIRDWIFVDDECGAILTVLEKGVKVSLMSREPCACGNGSVIPFIIERTDGVLPQRDDA
jgi:dTDP-D-glucose 4,6-dehydratase